MNNLDERIIEAARTVAGYSVLVVFESRASGRPRPTSDLDVAVLPTVAESEARRRLQARLAVALADLAPDGRVDVVLLDEAPELLRQRIMESGRVLICDDPRAWRDLRVQTMREHGDREWARELLRESQKKRLQQDVRDGRSRRAVVAPERA